MTDLTHASTADLVRELAGRIDDDDIIIIPELEIGSVEFVHGPATILVVRGEREWATGMIGV